MLMLTTGSFNLGMMTALSLLYIHTRQHYHYHFRSGENYVATPHIIIVWSRELQHAYDDAVANMLSTCTVLHDP